MATTKDKVEETSVWSKMKEILVPKATDGDSNYLIASVNGRVFKVKRGVRVEVPEPIAEVIENSFKAQEDADAYIEGLTSPEK